MSPTHFLVTREVITTYFLVTSHMPASLACDETCLPELSLSFDKELELLDVVMDNISPNDLTELLAIANDIDNEFELLMKEFGQPEVSVGTKADGSFSTRSIETTISVTLFSSQVEHGLDNVELESCLETDLANTTRPSEDENHVQDSDTITYPLPSSLVLVDAQRVTSTIVYPSSFLLVLVDAQRVTSTIVYSLSPLLALVDAQRVTNVIMHPLPFSLALADAQRVANAIVCHLPLTLVSVNASKVTDMTAYSLPFSLVQVDAQRVTCINVFPESLSLVQVDAQRVTCMIIYSLPLVQVDAQRVTCIIIYPVSLLEAAVDAQRVTQLGVGSSAAHWEGGRASVCKPRAGIG